MAQAQREQSKALTPVDALSPMRLPVTPHFLEQAELTESYWRALSDSIFPNARSVDGIILAVTYCRARGLDVLKKPVNVVPMWSSQLKRYIETVWPSINEIRITAARTGVYAGIDKTEFGPDIERDFVQYVEDERDPRNNREVRHHLKYPEYCDIVVYRMVQGVRCPFHGRVYWEEAYASLGKSDCPNEMWRKRTRGQLEKCCEAHSLRRAFPEELQGLLADVEMHGRTIDNIDDPALDEHIVKPRPPMRAPSPPKPGAAAARTDIQEDVADPKTMPGEASDADIVDADFEDIQHDDNLIDDTQYFEELQDRMNEVKDLAAIDEVWRALAPEARFANDAVNLDICDKIKRLRIKIVGGRPVGESA